MHRSPRLRRAGSAERPSALLLAVLLSLHAAAPSARAADPEAEPPPEPAHQVGTVTVTATRAEREVLEVPGNVTVIEREEIEQSGARDVPSLLRREAGLSVTRLTAGPMGARIEARGFNNGGSAGSSLLVLVDGRRVSEADSAVTDWALIDLDEVESIEIVRGPVSALYGDNAIGGVVDIRTRPVEGPPRATLRDRVGRYDSAQGSFKAAGTVGHVTGSFFVNGATTDGYRRGADFKSIDVKGSLQTEFRERVLLGASGGRYHDERGFPGPLTRDELDTLGRRAQDPDSAGTGSEVENRFVEGWLHAVLAENLLLRVQPYYSWRDEEATNVFSFGAGINTDIRDKSSLGVNTQVQLDEPFVGLRNRLIAGFDFLRDETDRRDVFGGLFDSLQISENRKSVYAGFLQEELNLTEQLLLSAGVRFDRAEYDLSTVDLLNAGDRATAAPDFSIWSPKAALTWRFMPNASAYFSYSRGFRLPNFDESAPTLTGGPPEIPDLEPQISNSFELGSKWRSQRVDASLALYWMKVKDEIILNPLLNCFPGFGCFGQNDNFERVRHRGVELALAVQILKWLEAYGNYTLDDVVVTKEQEPLLEGARMPITPRHRGNLGLVARFPLDVELTAHALFTGKRIVSNDFDRQAAKLDRYATLDLLLAWRPRFGEHVEGALSAALRNVTGQEYDGFAVRSVSDPTRVGFYPAPKRTWEVGVMLTVRK